MKIIKTALIAASFAVVAAAANAQGAEDLLTHIHGEPAAQTYSAPVAPRAGVISQEARGAFARSVAPRARQQSQQQDANPLLDQIHGN
jgi:hypothetical protein